MSKRAALPTARHISGSCRRKSKVPGRLAQGELTLKQTYQMLSGTLKTGNTSAPITNGKVNGDQISSAPAARLLGPD